MALFVRKITFATRFCDALMVYFRLFLNSKPFFHVSLHFVCTFRRCFFFLWLSLALHPLFCNTIRNKSQPRVKTRGLQNGPIGAIIPAAPKGAQ